MRDCSDSDTRPECVTGQIRLLDQLAARGLANNKHKSTALNYLVVDCVYIDILVRSSDMYNNLTVALIYAVDANGDRSLV